MDILEKVARAIFKAEYENDDSMDPDNEVAEWWFNQSGQKYSWQLWEAHAQAAIDAMKTLTDN